MTAALLLAAGASAHAITPLSERQATASEASAVATVVKNLPTGQTVSGTVFPGTMHAFTLTLGEGELVQGRLQGPRAMLDLLDPDGRHLRRLHDPDRLERGFMFVAPRAGTYRLRLGPPAADRDDPALPYRLTIDKRMPARSQPRPAAIDSPTIRALQAALATGGDTERFWRDVAARGTPLVEPAGPDESLPGMSEANDGDVLVTFLWRGARANVRLLGSPSGDHESLTRLGQSDVWYRSFRVPAGTRQSYQLAPDVPDLDGSPMERRRAILATAQRDPLNPRAFPADGGDAYRTKSVLELPGAPPQPWVTPRAGVPSGTLQRHRVSSKALGNTRDVWIYRPPGMPAQKAHRGPLLVIFDAHAYLTLVPTPTILDNLIADGLLPPTAALIVANPSAPARATELPPNPAFARFLADELMPWARTQGLRSPARRTVIAGASYGGLAATYAGFRHPEWFGNVLSQSGSHWWAPAEGDAATREPGWLTRQFAASPRLPLRFYLEAGRFEDVRGGRSIFTTTRHLRDVLRARGYPVRHAEFASGHDYLQWRGTLACGLMALIGTPEGQMALANPAGMPAQACPMSGW